MNDTFEFESCGVPVRVKRLDYGIQVGCYLYRPTDADYRVLDALLSRNAALEAELAAAKDDYATMLNANMDNVERLTALRAEVEALKKQVAEAQDNA